MAEVIVTVNGKPVNQYLNSIQPKAKLAPTQEQLILRSIKHHISTRNNRNTSGARSGKCKVIVQNGVIL